MVFLIIEQFVEIFNNQRLFSWQKPTFPLLPKRHLRFLNILLHGYLTMIELRCLVGNLILTL